MALTVLIKFFSVTVVLIIVITATSHANLTQRSGISRDQKKKSQLVEHA